MNDRKINSLVSPTQTAWVPLAIKPSLAWGITCCILLLAAVVRILPADRVFPAQGDASHFVQGGLAFRHGNPEGIDGYWSIGPQFIVAIASRIGLDPARVLQASTILAGVWLVFGAIFLAKTLTGDWLAGWLAGLLVASTPILVDSSTAGLAETPHMALAVSGFAFWHHAFLRRQWPWAIAGSLLLAFDLYYRPFDLFILLGVFALFIVVQFRCAFWKFAWRPLLAGGIVFILAGLPFVAITKAKQADSAASSKLVNLAFAEHGLDAKIMYGAKGVDSANNPLVQEVGRLASLGAPRYIWTNRERIARNYMSNLLKAARHLNSHAFTGALRMGLAWFMLFSLGCFYGAYRNGIKLPTLYVAASIASVPAALSIGLIHPRWIMQCLPFYFILAAMALASGWTYLSSPRWRATALAIFLALVLTNARWSVRQLDDKWKGLNIVPAAERLRLYADEGDKLMCFGPSLPISFFHTNVYNYVEIPYGEIDRIALWADLQKVDVIALNSSIFPHFPIHKIAEDPSLVPTNWIEVDRIQFQKHTRFELETDQYVFYRRKENRED
jgi:hypothetical protein